MANRIALLLGNSSDNGYQSCFCLQEYCPRLKFSSETVDTSLKVVSSRQELAKRLEGYDRLMKSNDYLNMVGNQIREESQWLKSYKANPSQYGSATKEKSSSNDTDLSQLQQLLNSLGSGGNNMSGILQQFMMIMMFQMLAEQQLSDGNVNNSNPPPYYRPNIQPGGPTTGAPPINPACVTALQDILGKTDSPKDHDLESLINTWQDKGFNESQLGRTAMYLLHQGDKTSAEKLESCLPDLFSNDILKPEPFLNDNYLSKLSEDRLATLSDSIASTGLQTADNKPNTHLIGRLLNSLEADSNNESPESVMAKDILYRLSQSDSNDKLLGNILPLAGFTKKESGKWEGPFTLHSQYPDQSTNITVHTS